MMHNRRIILGSLAALAIGPSLAAAAPTNGAAAPAFTALDTQGKQRSLAEFAGKTVVLEWTNHDCPYVKKHYGAGNMQALQREATADGVVWLSVISSAPGKQGHVTATEADALTRSRGAAPSAVLLDAKGDLGRLYGAKTTPHMYIITPDGKVVFQGGIDDKPTANPADLATARNHVRAALADMKAGRPIAVASSAPYGCSVKY